MDGLHDRCGQVCVGENRFVAIKGTKNFPPVLGRSWNLSRNVLEGVTEKVESVSYGVEFVILPAMN